MSLAIDYIDADLAYLLGLLTARGELSSIAGTNRLTIHFPKGALLAKGEHTEFDTEKEIPLGIEKVRERIVELTGLDVRTADAGDSWDLVGHTARRTMVWRDLVMLMNHQTHFSDFSVPDIISAPDTPADYKREFVRGFADVAGNIRPANRDQAGRHRVRLDVLNHPGSWKVPVQLCLLLQEGLGVPVPLITWGHPNLGRAWREHQLNVYAEEFERIGFYFSFKQLALEELAASNRTRWNNTVKGCPGARRQGIRKASDQEEGNEERLPEELLNKHFESYWQICRALGCPRRPVPGEQIEMIPEVAE